MTDLRRLNAGQKLIKKILSGNDPRIIPQHKLQKSGVIDKTPNPHNQQSRIIKK